MNRYYSYLNSAVQIIVQYNGEEPFSSFLKKFFSANKKYGSTDRKHISHLCYCYFRLGKMKTDWAPEERIPAALFLCSTAPNEILQQVKPEWADKVSLSVNEKISFLNAEELIENIFPFSEPLSEDIEQKEFVLSHLKQPDVFLRLRPGKENIVKDKLEKAGLSFNIVSSNCLSLPNTSKIDEAIGLNKEAVVQDYNSQKTGDLLQSSILNLQSKISAWDCCAGSGGKSIMLHDLYPQIDLTVSDTRETILINLKKRFREANIVNYKSFVADLAASNFVSRTSNFDLILADVPCSGSGTWGRTPEQLVYFDNKKIDEYASLQKKIVSGIIPSLRPGGHLLYITCSVFKKENEEAIEFIQQKFNLTLVKKEVLKGYDKKADTMFVALMVNGE